MRKTVILFALLSLSLNIHCQGSSRGGGEQQQDIRKPAVAGQFYPADPEKLREQVENFLRRTKVVDIRGQILGIIAPHAGYMYSGWVAAHAFKQLIGKQFDVVVVISPSHVERFRGSSVYTKGGYETPLGVVPVDAKLAQKIASLNEWVYASDRGHRQEHLFRREHAVEVELPFLQIVLGDFKLVPIVMGTQSYKDCQALAQALAEALKGKKPLIVASSDLSHFHPYDKACKMDGELIKYIENYDYQGLARGLDSGEIEACGGGPIIATMMAAQKLGANRAKVLIYKNSGDVTGDKSSVVGYTAAILYKESKQIKEGKKVGVSLGLTDEEKRQLLEIARITIEKRVKGEKVPPFTVTSERLREPRGAFVTIKKHGMLRGCIGYVLPVKPLYQAVREMAEAAALRDYRFPPVTPDELEELQIEISALTVPKEIKDIHEIEVGKHGIIIEKGSYSGLLLPQVATEYGWDRITFLEETCRKAGLPKDAWKDKDTRIMVFSAEVFGEE